MIVREVFPNGLRVVTESMPDVRSVSVGVWLTRGSRHENIERNGIAHFVEHMLFKGTDTRTAEDIAQAIDSIGGQLDAFTAKECASYYIKVLDEHLPLAFDILSDLVLNPAFRNEDIEREKKVVLEEIKMVEDTPDDLVHELFTQHFWGGHALGRPILGNKDTIERLNQESLREYFRRVYTAGNFIISVAGNLEHDRVRELISSAFGLVPLEDHLMESVIPVVTPKLIVRSKKLEQSHICLGVDSYPQGHKDRYISYVLNTMLGGSMSSRLFQNIREKRGLAYAVASGLSAYRDAGALTVYAGCDSQVVGEVVDLVVEEVRGMRTAPIPEIEVRRAKDHLKGNLMLSLEDTASRMAHMARQELCFGRQFDLDETLAGVESVTADDVQRVARDLFGNGSLAATILGPSVGLALSDEQLKVG